MSKKQCVKCVNVGINGGCTIFNSVRVENELLEAQCSKFEKIEKIKKTNIEKVAEMLNLKIGADFNIMYGNRLLREEIYCFSENALLVSNRYEANNLIGSLLSGEYTTRKASWKPKYGEQYYFVNSNGDVMPIMWQDNTVDYNFYNAKNYFQTREEITPEIITMVLFEMKEPYEKF